MDCERVIGEFIWNPGDNLKREYNEGNQGQDICGDGETLNYEVQFTKTDGRRGRVGRVGGVSAIDVIDNQRGYTTRCV